MTETTRMISRVLVANRGEIARRVFRTCRDLGIETVAVFSDADADAPYVREAHAGVHLPGTSPSDTYLRGDLVVEAARTAGADAVHPGYGFLSESADFARQVVEAGLTWVGPPPAAIEAMGSKVAAKKLMADAGVPVLPELGPSAVTLEQLPVLVKASAGGGGRGMRVVRELDTLQQQVAEASAEAASAFGDPTVFCEPYVEQGRHVEMQVLADSHGTVWVLGERDCSVQRRHQKVVEESPSPAVDAALRAELTAAAESAAKAVGYVGAGTVEFLLHTRGAAPRVSFSFLEMNTRLQVEHPVTECVFGIDLVAQQLAIAEGGALTGSPPQPLGHAIEARLYAEDPAADWLAQSGRVHRFEVPDVDAEFGVPSAYGLRLDGGLESGCVVSPHYDAMLAKVVSWAPTRAAAARRLAGALASARIHGLRTNRDLLVGILRDGEFLAGRATTAFLGAETVRRLALPQEGGGERGRAVSALAAALADAQRRRTTVAPAAWRSVPSQPQEKRYLVDDAEVSARYRDQRGRLVPCDVEGVEVLAVSPDAVTLRIDGVDERLEVSTYDDGTVSVDSAHLHADLRRIPRFTDPQAQVGAGSLLAPMPASVVRVAVGEGEPVEPGQPIVVLEAMKMQHTIRAHDAGTVSTLSVAVGDQVDAGSVLAVVTPEGDEQ
ncbi:MAG TPA: biotin carboxylase N-terminal domain-containing protein [Nocardioidaceae bacterium]|nr:biotin carboxylase N-terminal domain-containing protein [Nocardioidaceae bacterium]